VVVWIHRSKLAELISDTRGGECQSLLGAGACRALEKVRSEVAEALRRTHFWTRHYIVSGEYAVVLYGAGFNEVGVEVKKLDELLAGYAPPHPRNSQPLLYGADYWHFGGRTHTVLDEDSFRAMLPELGHWLAEQRAPSGNAREIGVQPARGRSALRA